MEYRELTPEEAWNMLNETRRPIDGEYKIEISEYSQWRPGRLCSVDVSVMSDGDMALAFFMGTGCGWGAKFRIPVEPKWRPLKEREIESLANLSLRHKSSGSICRISVISGKTDSVWISLGAGNVLMTAAQLFDEFTHLDGSPVGIKE